MKFPVFSPAVLRGLAAGLALAAVLKPAPAGAQPGPPRSDIRPAYDQWTTYLNPKLAFQVPVPPGLRAQQDPRKGRSCRFASDDGLLVLKTWGNVLGPQPGDPLEGAWRDAVNQRGRRIDFQRRSPTEFVLAGVNGDGSEFYEKVILGDGAAAGINVSYPASLVSRFAPWVAEIEGGFGWHPDSPAVQGEGGPPPPRGFFSGIRQYFTGEDEVPEPRPPGGLPSGGGNQAVAPVPAIPRDPGQTQVDLTPPAPAKPKENPAVIPLENPVTPPPAPEPKPAPVKREDLPYGISIPGKKGYVYSPFIDNKQQVDVTDIPTGTKVKCPYTGKVFRVP